MIVEIELKNIRSFSHEKFQLTDGKNLIVGSNGAGKTTIIDCIGYVLFGYEGAIRSSERIIDENNNQISKSDKFGLIRYDTAGEAYIDIRFKHEIANLKSETTLKTDYRVKVTFTVRKNKNPDQHWELWVNDKAYNTTNKMEDVQREFWKLIGLDSFNKDTFFQSILCIPQGEIVQPFEYKPTDRFKYFDNLFGIAQKGELEEKYKIIDQILEKEINSLNTQNSELKGKVANKEEILNRLQENNKEKPNVEAELSIVTSTLNELNIKLNYFNTLEKKLSTVSQKIMNNDANIGKMNGQIADLEIEIQDFRKKIEFFEEYNQIHQEFSKINTIKNEIDVLESKILNIEKQKAKSEGELETAKKSLEQLENDLKIITAAEPNHKKYIEIESKLRSLRTCSEKRAQILNLIESIKERIKALNIKIETLKIQLKDYDEINNRVIELRKDSEELIKASQDKSNMEKEIIKDEKTLKDFGDKVCPFTSEKCAASTEVSNSISEKLNQKKMELQEINKKIQTLKEKTKDLKPLETKLIDLNNKLAILKEIQRDLVNSNGDLQTKNEELKNFPDKTQEITDFENELENLKADYSTVITFQKQGKTSKKLQSEIVHIQKNIQNTNDTVNRLAADLDNLMNFFSKGNYNLKLDESLKAATDNKIFVEKAKFTVDLKKRSEMPSQIKKSEDLSPLKSLLSDYFKALQFFEREFNELLRIKEIQLPEKINQKQRADAQLAEYNELAKILNAELEKIKNLYDQNEHTRIRTEYDRINEKKGSLQEKINQINKRIEEDTKSLKQIEKWENEMTEIQKNIDLRKKEQALNEKIKKSMVSLTKLREKYINHVNREVQNINIEIGQPGIEIFWDPNYVIYIRKAKTLLTFNQLSGGQKVLYALMIRLAINKLFSKRFGLFILDEPTIHLDEDSRKVLSDFIDKMEGIKQLIIVSHTDEFLGTIDNEIQLTQNEFKTINATAD